MFVGLEKVTNRLENPVPGLEDMFVTLTLNKPLLNDKQKEELNPMIIKIHSATCMPNAPMSYDQLKQRYAQRTHTVSSTENNKIILCDIDSNDEIYEVSAIIFSLSKCLRKQKRTT